MKEAVMLIVVLMMGIFASQAFGFSLSAPDTDVPSVLYRQVDTMYEEDPARLATIAGKLPSIQRHFNDNPADSELLDKLQTYISYKLNEPEQSEVSSPIASALSRLFD